MRCLRISLPERKAEGLREAGARRAGGPGLCVFPAAPGLAEAGDSCGVEKQVSFLGLPYQSGTNWRASAAAAAAVFSSLSTLEAENWRSRCLQGHIQKNLSSLLKFWWLLAIFAIGWIVASSVRLHIVCGSVALFPLPLSIPSLIQHHIIVI